ncbi:hypothetical protein C0993_002187 [Termitomyces sp. T159_Od127]|nr:hypothetical protein C0993_002187 [Termitomyces sp. T159_Od127]
MSDAGPHRQPQGASDLPYYVSQFRTHLAEVRAHLVGVVGDDPPPSFIPPTGYWTPSEKNAFFHSLSVYSRFRPDLVAASIGSKSVLDVCAYIDILDEAIARDAHFLLPRSDLPSAVEVSNDWIAREENMAEGIISLETSLERAKLLLRREEEISIKKGLQVDAPPIEEGLIVETLETWECDRRRCWGQEDALSKLECHHLKVMERILNDAESGDANVGDPRPEDQEAEPVDETPPSDRDSQSLVVSDGMPGFASQRYLETSPHVEIPRDTLSALSFTSSPQASSPDSLVVRPLGSPRLPSPDSDRETGDDLSALSPVSRRRLQKRLHMRRKRAIQRGEDVYIANRKLRPGRKVKASRSRGEQPIELIVDKRGEDALMEVDQGDGRAIKSTKSTTREEIDEENEEDNSEWLPGHHRKNRGLTKPYKIKRDFESQGIDYNTLIDGNLGFFHLSTLGRLMTIYKSGFDVEESDTASSISADTIRLFSAILVEFVTEVVHRSVSLREQENSIKANIKVYHRTSDDITLDNVMHVLEMMGMMGLSKEQYFAQLLEDDIPALPETAQTEDEVAHEDGNDSPLLEESTVLPLPLPLPLQREIHPPLVTLPMSLMSRAQVRSRSVAPAEGDLMPIETDEEKLFEELDDEMNIDNADKVLADEYEINLWKSLDGR